MNIQSMFPSKYLKASELPAGKQVKLTIKNVTVEKFQDGSSKLAISFQGVDKLLIANKTNTLAIAKVLGDEADRWVGGKVTLIVMPVTFQNKTVDSIRVIAVEAAAAGPVAPAPVAPVAPAGPLLPVGPAAVAPVQVQQSVVTVADALNSAPNPLDGAAASAEDSEMAFFNNLMKQA